MTADSVAKYRAALEALRIVECTARLRPTLANIREVQRLTGVCAEALRQCRPPTGIGNRR